MLLDICDMSVAVEAVACMSLINAFTQASLWPLAEAAFMLFFRQTGHFGRVDVAAGEAQAAAESKGESVSRAWSAIQDAAAGSHDLASAGAFCVLSMRLLHRLLHHPE
jgi:hypothetical protein